MIAIGNSEAYVGPERGGIEQRPIGDSVASQAALAAHLYTPAGQNDYANARTSLDNTMPAQFRGVSDFSLFDSAQTSGIAGQTSENTLSPMVPAAALASTAAETADIPTALPPNATTELTPDQTALAAATVQISTPVVTVSPDGTLTESTNQGTGFIVNGANGQQFVVTAGHVDDATPQTTAGGTSYAESPDSTITLANGTQITATLAASGASLPADNYVQIGGPNPDVSVLSIPFSGVAAPYPALNLASGDQLPAGSPAIAYGYPNGTLTAETLTSLGMVSPSQLVNNPTGSNTQELAMQGAGIPGMSGGPVVNSNGDVAGVYSAGNSAISLDATAGDAASVLNTQNPFSPNFLSNLFNGNGQVIATPDLRGNSADQSLTGVTLSDGTYLQQPLSANPTPSTTDAVQPSASAPTADAPPAVSTSSMPDDAAASVTTPPITDNFSSTPIDLPDVDIGGGFFDSEDAMDFA